MVKAYTWISPKNYGIMDYDLIMEYDLGQDTSETKKCVRPIPAEWMKPFRKESSAATLSTLVGSFRAISRRTVGSNEFSDRDEFG